MLKSLKTPDEYENVEIEIENIDDGVEDADIDVRIDGRPLKINAFTQGILKETVYAIINTLKINDEIHKINIEMND